MSFAAVAVAGAAVVGGVVAANGAKSAAKTQADSANAATAAQKDALNQQIQLQAPWRQTGQQGLSVLSQYLGLTTPDQVRSAPGAFDAQRYYDAYLNPGPGNAGDRYYNSPDRALEHYNDWGRAEGKQAFYLPSTSTVIPDNQFGSLLKPFGMEDFQKDPGYDFRLNEGRKTLEGSAAARGGLFSGGAGKALERYGQDYGSSEYGKAYDRYNSNQTNQFNRLASIAGLGQTAANQTGAAVGGFGSQIGSNIIGAGNANAAGQVGQANAFNNAVGQGYNMYQSNELMRRLQAPSTSYGGYGMSGGGGFGTGLAYGNQDYGQFV